ncbi:sugar phosphate isomerase/epimerase family protein, partial [Actinosynnema sp.]|uniref:sugar phosphate isomerase/epimerase family protein n=1 Tax=Actinosynnema sp. TaxID=1872144 RepID=UPI003F8361F3
SEAAGLGVGVYGSGYRAGCDDPEEFAAVLDSAQSLGAPGVLVRAGGVAPWEATAEAWSFVVAELRRCVRLAAERDLVVVAEHSATSLFGTLESALRLLADVPGLAAHWRALGGSGAVLAEVSALLPSLAVLSCGAGDPGASAALELLARDGGARMALLEPASGDATAVVRDGRALLALLGRRP